MLHEFLRVQGNSNPSESPKMACVLLNKEELHGLCDTVWDGWCPRPDQLLDPGGDGAGTRTSVIVVGGTIGATFVCFPMKTVMGWSASFERPSAWRGESSRSSRGWKICRAELTRRDFYLDGGGRDQGRLLPGLGLVVDGQEADTIETSWGPVASIRGRHNVGADLFSHGHGACLRNDRHHHQRFKCFKP